MRKVILKMTVSNDWNLFKCLQGQYLNFIIIDLNSFKDTLHDKVSLIFDCEILLAIWQCVLERLKCQLCCLDVLVRDIHYCTVKDRLHLILAQSTVLCKFTDEFESLNSSKSVALIIWFACR